MTPRSRRSFLGSATFAGLTAAAGCLGVLDRSEGSESAPEEFPPGTDDSGVTDPDALFDAHRGALSESSYTYRLLANDSAKTNVRNVIARRAAGVDAARFVRERRVVSLQDEPAYRAEADVVTDSWHGPSTTDLEYTRTRTDTLVSDEEAYLESSVHADEYPPGEHTEYERYPDNTLLEIQQDYPRGLVLQPLLFEFAGSYTEAGETRYRFEVEDVRPGVEENPLFQSTDDLTVSGAIVVQSDGVVRRSLVTVDPSWSADVGQHTTAITDLGATSVRDEPAWVDSEFGED